MANGDGADALAYSMQIPVRDLTITFEGKPDEPMTDFFKMRAATPGAYAPPVPPVRPDGALNAGDWVFGKSVWHYVHYNQNSEHPIYARCNFALRFDHKSPYIWRAVEGAVPLGPLCKGCSNSRKPFGQRGSGAIRFPTSIIEDEALRARVERRIRSNSQVRYRFYIEDATV